MCETWSTGFKWEHAYASYGVCFAIVMVCLGHCQFRKARFGLKCLDFSVRLTHSYAIGCEVHITSVRLTHCYAISCEGHSHLHHE